MNRSTSLTVNCPLCGKEFEKTPAVCANCPLHSQCDLVRCPNCGYQFPPESKIIEFFKNMFKKRREPECPPEISTKF